MHFSTRPAHKLVNHGASTLDTTELLAILFGNGTKDKSSIELANHLLIKYGLNRFDELGFNELKNECEGDYIKALRILSLAELFKRYNKSINNGYRKSITCSNDVYEIFKDDLVGLKKEHFYVLLLDTKNKIIKKELVSIGTLNSSLVHPREVFKSAIKESANSIILIHNHPSGDLEPSMEDKEITEKLMEAGEILNIKVLDHVIIGKDNYHSFKENS